MTIITTVEKTATVTGHRSTTLEASEAIGLLLRTTKIINTGEAGIFFVETRQCILQKLKNIDTSQRNKRRVNACYFMLH